ncbi:MAG: hypothetical protein P8012_05680 [Desulfobacterales bacterium]
MTESNEPDKKGEAAEPAEEQPIIEPKDEATDAPTGDEEPIDLTESVEESPGEDPAETVEAESEVTGEDEALLKPDQETEEELKGDAEIIDLLQAVDESSSSAKDQDETVSEEPTVPAEDQAPRAPKEEVTDESKDDEEIIDLLDAAEEISVTAEDDEIIDLTDTVSGTSLEIEDVGEPIPDAADDLQEFDDVSEIDSDLIEETIDVADELDSETISDDVLKADFTDSLGIELDSEENAEENLFDPDKVSGEQIEAALERVITKMFYEKIDRLLVDAIEKTVTREIEKLKKALLDDATDGEK